MDKAKFVDVLSKIVAGFEDPVFREQFAAAKGAGDVARMMELPMQIQARAFAAHGLDAAVGTAQFKEAGRKFGLDEDVAPLLSRMRAAL
ncbi:MAG: hypothetical protein FJ100_05995 [Deltaproteobacteria bacterium]|nr:hypothetical protein [Deltaproteobacteria bacterium]